jgi:hypothetical protein
MRRASAMVRRLPSGMEIGSGGNFSHGVPSSGGIGLGSPNGRAIQRSMGSANRLISRFMKRPYRTAMRSIRFASTFLLLAMVAKPQLPITELPNAQGGVFYTYSGYSSSCPGVCANYSVTLGGLPPGLAIDPSTGILSGTPTVAGRYFFQVRATLPQSDGASTFWSAQSLTVTPPIAAGAPISATSLQITLIALITLGLIGMRQLRQV